MAQKQKFIIKSDNEESFEVYLGRKHIVSVNHDEDGWQGMQRVRDTVDAIGKELAIPVVSR